MRLYRRQILSMAARAASAMILSACGSTNEIPPPRPTSTSVPRPTASSTRTPRGEIPTSTPAIPAPISTSTARPTIGVTPTATPESRPETPVAQSSIDLQPPAGAIPATYFGLHIHRATTTTPWPVIPFGAWRLWDAGVSWSDLEPRNSNWDFRLLDQYVTLAQKHNVDLLLPLGFTPTWASARPNEISSYFQPGRNTSKIGAGTFPRSPGATRAASVIMKSGTNPTSRNTGQVQQRSS